MKIAVMTDSTAYIPAETREKYHIHMVPLNVAFGDTSYQEEVDITTEAFYQKVREAEHLPTTSQPSIGLITEKLNQLAEAYDAVISVHLSSGISGTCQEVASAGEMVDGIKVYAYDSGLSGIGQGFYVYEAAEMVQGNTTPEEIIACFDEMKQSMRAYFMVDDLKNLQRGGRLNNAQAIVGSLLQVKPVLHFVDKVIVPFEKIRTRKKALNRILGMLEDDLDKGKDLKVAFVHANCKSAAEEIERQEKEKYPDLDSSITYLGPVIGTHLGEGSLGFVWYEK